MTDETNAPEITAHHLSFAQSEPQREAIQALLDHGGGVRAAARALGKDPKSIREARDRVLARAGRKGYAPHADLVHEAAEGMIVKGTSIRYNGSGQVEQYWNKTRTEGMDPEDRVQLPDPKTITKVSTMFDQEGRVTQQWVAEKPELVAQVHAWEEFIARLVDRLPILPPVKRKPTPVKSDILQGYPIGDHHLGMLAWGRENGGQPYDLKIGEKMLHGAMDYLVDNAPPAETALIAILGDFFHYDSIKPVTPTNEHQLDSDSRFQKMIDTAIDCAIYAVESALRKHERVHVIPEIGNHDLYSMPFLAAILYRLFRDNPRVTIDRSPWHYHYYQFGKVLVATHHGHGSKMDQLPGIMANDVPKMWGDTEHRFWWTGHVHHSQKLAQKDYTGCEVESFRILAPADAYAMQNGYRSKSDMTSITFHREWGELGRTKISPQMLFGGGVPG